MSYIDSNGFRVFDHDPAAERRARRKTFCNRCHSTIWQNETVVLAGKNSRGWEMYNHLDCILALNDSTPRQFNEKVFLVRGGVPDKHLLKKKTKAIVAKHYKETD